MDNGNKLPISYATAIAVVLLFSTIFVYIYFSRLAVIPSEAVDGGDPLLGTLSAEPEGKQRQLTTKQLKKRELKKEKQRKQAELIEERKEKEQRRKELSDLYEYRLEQREKAQREEESKKLEEDDKVYKEIAQSFTVENEGNVVDSETLNLEEFTNFVIWKKMTNVNELSSRFGLTNSVVVDRLLQLEDDGHLFGVLDDRGRYLYITDYEVEALTHYIESSGRINKYRSLASFCNATFTVEPTKDNAIKLQKWENSTLNGIDI
ncbi:hypothetical protein BgAZ_404840 [Babesia gibsoni]|uniref:DDRGK domain-containing protein 1 n=1 Tax=Babesia gibsoni TaxID=33632 RepID=A0AAD8LHS6_BABGI|nr:hypothetical protein BgAZ_404840 [Babesia gibsoni]